MWLRAAPGLPFFAWAGTVITSVTGAALPLLRLAARREGRGVTLGGVVLTVNGDGAVVERQLAGGELACPQVAVPGVRGHACAAAGAAAAAAGGRGRGDRGGAGGGGGRDRAPEDR